MGVFYEAIPDSLVKWIMEQHMFWVATAPLSGKGHINVSPKGGDYFGVLDSTTFWYMELTGSGSETHAHLYENGNGRITVMFNAFEGPPKIVRLWGYGRVLENKTPDFEAFIEKHNVTTIPGTRAIIMVDIHQVGSSCGFSVPFYDFKEHRTTLNDHFAKMQKKWDEKNDKVGMDQYWAYKNAWSMDGMPAMKRALEAGKAHSVDPIKKMVGPLAPKNGVYNAHPGVSLLLLLIVAVLSFVMGVMFTTYQPTIVNYGIEAKEGLQHVGNLVNRSHRDGDGMILTALLRR